LSRLKAECPGLAFEKAGFSVSPEINGIFHKENGMLGKSAANPMNSRIRGIAQATEYSEYFSHYRML
jgi:hypothetical protein